MKNKALVIAVMAACLTTGASAFAQTYDDRGVRYDDRYEQRDYRDYRYNQDGRYTRGDRYDRPGGGYQPEYRRHRRGAGPGGEIHPGERLPAAFWGKQYVVRDWERRRLDPPLRGHYWVRTGNDYVMSSVSTGIVAQVVLNRR